MITKYILYEQTHMNEQTVVQNDSNKAIIQVSKTKQLIKVAGLGFLSFFAIATIALSNGSQASAQKATTQQHDNVDVRPTLKVDEMYLDYNDYIQYVGQISCPINEDFTTYSQGSGYVVNENGEFVTNYHVVDGMVGDSCIIGFSSDYRKAPYEMYVAKLTNKFDKDKDYVVLQITSMFEPTEKIASTIKFKFMPTCNSDIVRLGDPIVVLGYPAYGGDTITATDGIISGSIDDFFKINARVNHGNSGGPVLIDDPQYGCAIGLASGGRGDESGEGDWMNLAIKTENIKL